MTENNGLRQAVRRACKSGTLVSCESCGRVESSPLAPSKAVQRLGWWRPDHDMIICDGCYRPPVIVEAWGWVRDEWSDLGYGFPEGEVTA